MPFQIWNTVTKQFAIDGDGPLTYDLGTLASTAARELTDSTGQKHQPRRTDDNVNWRARENQRYEDGSYVRVPWIQFNWFREAYPSDHFVHLSMDKAGFVAFTPDEQKGKEDRQTRMRGGAYLTKFFSGVLCKAQITQLATELAGELEANELKFATTQDDIERVYLMGPSSCMSHSLDDYYSSVHPVRVYAAGDLAIAYLERGDDNKRVTARTVCWPEKKIYTGIYGDGIRLEPLLKRDGYKAGSIDGAKLLKIREGGGYVCPYVDNCDYVDVGPTHLILRRRDGEYTTDSTNGVIGDCDYASCAACECTIRNEDDAHTVYTGRGRERIWCASCDENSSVYCEDEQITVSVDCVVRMADDTYWSEWHFEREGGNCDYTDENYPADELRTVTLKNGDEQQWCDTALRDYAVRCDVSEEWYAKDATVKLPDGRVVGFDTEEAEIAKAAGEAKEGPHIPSLTAPHPDQTELALKVAHNMQPAE